MSKKIKLKISARLMKKKFRRQVVGAKKHCRFCGSTDQEKQIDYKNAYFLRAFLTERGKILPSRISGNCSAHQRCISGEMKKARIMALLPYIAPWT
jgi:small subunit ribosomal protein S18